VTGLRREELAELAGVSVDYYTRLEQGRHGSASPAVLEAIATALRLPTAEREYLHRLADVNPTGRVASPVAPQVRPETLGLLRALGPTPGILLGPSMDVLAINAAGRRLYTDFDALPVEERNALRWMLRSPDARRLHSDEWAEISAEMIGMLRLRAGRTMAHPEVHRLVTELHASNAFFREVWADQTVSTGSRRTKQFLHAEAGPIVMDVETLSVRHAPEQTLVVLVPPAGSPSERAWHEATAHERPPA